MFETHLAYADPGTGAILLQLLIGSMAGMVFVFRQSIVRFLKLIRRNG